MYRFVLLFESRVIRTNAFMALLVLDAWASCSEISSGFIRIFSCCLLLYFLCGINLPVDSPGQVSISPSFSVKKVVSISPSFSVKKYRLSPFLLALKGDAFLVLLPSNSFSLLTSLPSYVVVCTGQKIISVFLVRESYFSVSPFYVTISQFSNFVVIALLC